ncbi:MAG: OmpH family outer membrane protein [Bacteroidota bacterium]
MKKLLFACMLLTTSLLFSNTVVAQTKIGYFNEDKTFKLFPGFHEVDSLLQVFREDSVGSEYERRSAQYYLLDSLNKKDCKTAIPGKSCEEVVKEIERQRAILQNWLTISQRMVGAKETTLLFPYRKKIYDALQEVLAEEKYTLVLETSALSIFFTPPILDNLMIRVAMKLQLPLTNGTMAAWKAAEAKAAKAAKPAPAAVKKK